MIYNWRISGIHTVSAQVAGEECERLAASEQGLTAKTLVDANRAKGTPLHDEFEWDDAIAAELHREQQARVLIACIVTQDETVTQEPIRAFVHIRAEENKEYKPIRTVLQNVSETEYMLKTALNELQAFQRKYERLQELTPIFEAISKVSA